MMSLSEVKSKRDCNGDMSNFSLTSAGRSMTCLITTKPSIGMQSCDTSTFVSNNTHRQTIRSHSRAVTGQQSTVKRGFSNLSHRDPPSRNNFDKEHSSTAASSDGTTHSLNLNVVGPKRVVLDCVTREGHQASPERMRCHCGIMLRKLNGDCLRLDRFDKPI